MNKSIGILGCGWLGLELGRRVILEGYESHGTARSEEQFKSIAETGITPHNIELKDKRIYGDLKNFLQSIETLIITLPPDSKNQQTSLAYRLKMVLTFATVYDIKYVIYTSSTGVFQDQENFPTYDENSAPNATSDRSKSLIAAEDEITSYEHPTTIIRLGGLIGSDRHPVTYLSGRENVANPDAPVNLVSRDYAIHQIIKLLKYHEPPRILHAVSEPHITREKYYTNQANERVMKAPSFDHSGKSVGKKVVSLFVN